MGEDPGKMSKRKITNSVKDMRILVREFIKTRKRSLASELLSDDEVMQIDDKKSLYLKAHELLDDSDEDIEFKYVIELLVLVRAYKAACDAAGEVLDKYPDLHLVHKT